MGASSSKKFGVSFIGFERLSQKLESIGGDLKTTSDLALRETHKTVTKKVDTAVAGSRYNFERTGKTKASIYRNPKPEWTGSVGEIGVGFDIANGGLPSVFLMYGTPRVTPDRKLFGAIFSTQTRRDVYETQYEVFDEMIERIMQK